MTHKTNKKISLAKLINDLKKKKNIDNQWKKFFFRIWCRKNF